MQQPNATHDPGFPFAIKTLILCLYNWIHWQLAPEYGLILEIMDNVNFLILDAELGLCERRSLFLKIHTKVGRDKVLIVSVTDSQHFSRNK